MQSAIEELKTLILSSFPDATIRVSRGEDPPGVYLHASRDTADLDDSYYEALRDLVREREFEMQVDEGLDIYVFPDMPSERAYERMLAIQAGLI
jgi:hypothetical protein